MDIKKHLLIENSRNNWLQVIAYVGNNPDRFKELMDLFMGSERILVQRSSQSVGVLGEKFPKLFDPYFPALIIYLNANPIDAVKRNLMRAFQFMDIPEEFEGGIFDIALTYLSELESPIAVKAFSMTVLRNLATKYPELAQEVIHQIEILVQEEVSKGVLSRGNKELKVLKKMLAKT